MTKPLRWGALALAALVALNGCATLSRSPSPPPEPPPAAPTEPPAPEPEPAPAEPEPAARSAWAEKTEKAALALEATGDLARALERWKVLQLLEPDDDHWHEREEGTKRLIAKKSNLLISQAETAAKAGDAKAASDLYLRVLALDPRDEEAARRLRELEASEIRERERAKVERTAPKSRPAEMQPAAQPAADSQASYYLETGIELYRQGEYEKSIVELDKYLDSFPDDRRARKHLAEAHVRLGQGDLKAGDTLGAVRHFEEARKSGGDATQAATLLQQAKKRLADELYDQGVRVSRTDIGKAIDYWKEAVSYDPNHLAARTQLDRAKRMQEKLKKIQ